MNRVVLMFGALIVGAGLVGCGDNSAPDAKGTLVVQGSVSSGLSIDNGRVVAIGTNGRTFWSYLDKHGDFTLKLPVGQSYRILVANQRVSGGQQVLGRLMVPSKGSKTQWLGANEPGTVNLGTLRPTSLTSGVQPKCSGCSAGGDGGASAGDGESADDNGSAQGSDHENDSADHDDDNECHEKGEHGSDDGDNETDDDEGGSAGDDTDVCSSGSTTDLEPSQSPDASKCEDKDSHEGEDYEENKACGGDNGSGSGSADSADDGSDDSTGDSASGDNSGSADSAGSQDASSGTSGGKNEGETCSMTSDCSSTCNCVASKCAAK
jgi:hypothetical protein